MGRAVTRESLGAWLIKGTGGSPSTLELVRTGFASATTRCIRPSYRADLVDAGQPVLFWISGDHPDHPAGIYAQGRVTGPAVPDADAVVMPLSLEPVDPPVLRSELRHHPELAALEVLRMPAGSNPSYVTRAQLEVLQREWPEVTVGA